MTHATTNLIKKAASAVALAGALFMANPAQAQVVVEFPTPEIIATTPPVYYGGRAHYWYNGRWYYRNGGSWAFYDHEPAYLHDWRGSHGYDHYYYEGHRGPVGRGGGWDHRGGWGGGHRR